MMYVRGHGAWPLAEIGRAYGAGELEIATRGIRIVLVREIVRRWVLVSSPTRRGAPARSTGSGVPLCAAAGQAPNRYIPVRLVKKRYLKEQ